MPHAIMLIHSAATSQQNSADYRRKNEAPFVFITKELLTVKIQHNMNYSIKSNSHFSCLMEG